MNYSFEEIEPYLLDYEIDSRKIHCEFQNNRGEVFSATSNLKETKDIQSKVAKRAERMIKSTARRNASRLVRTAFGGGMLGRLGSSVVRQGVNDVEISKSKNYSESDIQEAIVKAFRRVARNFELGQKNTRAAERQQRRPAATPSPRRSNVNESEMSYQEYVAANPISNLFEQDIMSRMLVQMAGADGKITEDEREFIQDLLPKKFGTIGEIQDRGDISNIEAQEVNDGVKKSIMLLAWSVALVDFELSNSEVKRLHEYGGLFGFDSNEAKSIELMAKQETLSGVMEPYMDKNELFDLAERLGITQEDAERMFIDYKKSM